MNATVITSDTLVFLVLILLAVLLVLAIARRV